MRTMRFAARTEWASEETAWSRALEARRRSGLSSRPDGFESYAVRFYLPCDLLADLPAEEARVI